MDLVRKSAVLIIFIYIICAFVYTLLILIRNALNRIKEVVKVIYNNREKLKHLYTISKTKKASIKDEIFRLVKRYLFIDSISSFKIYLLMFSISAIYLLPKDRNNFLYSIISLISIAIYFWFFGEWLAKRYLYNDLISRIGMYLMKFGVFLIFSLSFFALFIRSLENNYIFIITIAIQIIYSMCFLKYVIDDFNNVLFLIINLALTYLYNLLIIGYIFGMYYLNNNETYKLWNNLDILKEKDLLVVSTSVVTRGLHYFYNYSEFLNVGSIFKGGVPFIEYILGTIYNIAIAGFFISYTASKAFTKITGNDNNIISQLARKKFRIAIDEGNKEIKIEVEHNEKR